MNLQIKSIILYNKLGKKRILDFKPAQVNIITGSSQKGKSSIINIIDYCLGRSDFQVAAGVISDNVEWYSLLCTIDDFEIFIAKPKPKPGSKSQSDAYLEIAKNVTIPEIKDLYINSNDEAIIAELSKRTGITPNINIPSYGESRLPLETNFSHAKLLLFQPQGTIANKDILFYRQTDSFISQAIKDSLLYFLGIIQEDSLNTLRLLQSKRREYRDIKSAIADYQNIKDTRVQRGKGLLEEAKQVGLIGDTDAINFIDQIILNLTPLRDWRPELIPPVVDEDVLFQKQNNLIENRKLFEELRAKIMAAETHIKFANGFVGEAGQQILRLESINLFESDEGQTEEKCPICGSIDNKKSSSSVVLKNSIDTLQKEVDLVSRESPEFGEYIKSKHDELEQLRETIKQQEYEINALIDENTAAINFRDTNNRISRVVGRISYFLEISSNNLDEELVKNVNKLNELESDIKKLEERLNATNFEDIKESVLNIIGTEMTKLSQELELEYQYPYRIDLNKLTVVADKPGSPIYLNHNMGSAANHLGSHLIAILALHKYFMEQNRPVPSFIVLDQLTQVYFPQDKYVKGDVSSLSDEDRQAVERIFRLIFEMSQKTGLQIIILEHANLSTTEFQNAIIDNVWRGDNALIPKEWIEQ